MGHFTLKGMMGDVGTIGKDAGDFHKVVLPGKKLRRKKFIITQAALGPIDSDVEPVRHLCVEGSCAAAYLAVFEFNVD